MTNAILRILELGLLGIRADDETIRLAVSGGRRPHLRGSATAVSGATLTDTTAPKWSCNLHGRMTHDGHAVPGDILRILTALPPRDYEIVSSLAQVITVDGDLEADGVVVGDRYEVRRREDDQAAEWFARTNIRIAEDFPGGELQNPCMVVHLESTSGEQYPSGRLQATTTLPDGARARQYVSRFNESYTVTCIARTMAELHQLRAVAIYILVQHSPMLDKMFTAGVSIQAGGPGFNPEVSGFTCQITVSGMVEITIARAINEDVVAARANLVPRRVN